MKWLIAIQFIWLVILTRIAIDYIRFAEEIIRQKEEELEKTKAETAKILMDTPVDEVH